MLLNCHSYYSLRYGTMKPEELVDEIANAGFDAAAITDINNTSATWDFVRLCKKRNIKPIVGIDFRNGADQVYVGIAKNRDGFYHLNSFLSAHLEQQIELPALPPQLPHCYWIIPFAKAQEIDCSKLSPSVYIGIHPLDIPRLRFSPISELSERLVAMATFSFRNKKDFNAHRLLRAIDNNLLLSKLPKEEEGKDFHKLYTLNALQLEFEDFHFILEQTEHLFGHCSIQLEGNDSEEVSNKNLQVYGQSAEEDALLIRQLCFEGLRYRYPELQGLTQEEVNTGQSTSPIIQRIAKELQIIEEKGYLSYFLINWDITSYARSKGYFYVGRGSGANSIVAYLLRITDVDPIELDLYFERFINLYRKNPPDFDIDFSWTDREDMTKYIFTRFPNVSLLAAYNTFQYRAVVRELGKVFGLPKHEIDLLSDGKFNMHEIDSTLKLVLTYSTYIQDFPNIISIHAAGILITNESIHRYTATFLPPKGFPTVHFDMVVAEDIGIYKFDILSQRGLGKIKECLEIISYNQPDIEPIDIHDMRRFKADERIKDLMRNAKAIGCFYVESPAMRMLMTKLRVDDYLGLVAASSVIRPGVSRSGMMREFILRHRFAEKRKDAHPILLDIMPETYGVMVYQEDVIKVAHYFGGLSLAEADSLRRGMSGKFRGREEFDQARNAFFEKALAKGHSLELASEIWRQIESFAGYAFAKGHSASYAVESYQSLFLKAYFPLEYMTATINNFGGFYSTEFYVHEARMHGGKIEAPCVNRGSAITVIYDQTLILGFGLVKDVEYPMLEALLAERRSNGLFMDLQDFISRVPCGISQLQVLIRVGAFRFTGRNKKDLLWEAHLSLSGKKPNEHSPELFATPVKTFELPPLEHTWIEDAYDEMELIGFPLCNPFQLLSEIPAEAMLARDLPALIGQTVVCIGYLVTTKPTRTAKGERMYFGNFLDQEGHFLDTVHFPPVSEQYAFRGRGLYYLKGKVCEEFGSLSIEISEMHKLSYTNDPRYAEVDKAERVRIERALQNTPPPPQIDRGNP